MNCVRFEMRLDELLDERLPPDSDAELNEHAETCPHCARLLADHQALLEAIEVLGPAGGCEAIWRREFWRKLRQESRFRWTGFASCRSLRGSRAIGAAIAAASGNLDRGDGRRGLAGRRGRDGMECGSPCGCGCRIRRRRRSTCRSLAFEKPAGCRHSGRIIAIFCAERSVAEVQSLARV